MVGFLLFPVKGLISSVEQDEENIQHVNTKNNDKKYFMLKIQTLQMTGIN